LDYLIHFFFFQVPIDKKNDSNWLYCIRALPLPQVHHIYQYIQILSQSTYTHISTKRRDIRTRLDFWINMHVWYIYNCLNCLLFVGKTRKERNRALVVQFRTRLFLLAEKEEDPFGLDDRTKDRHSTHLIYIHLGKEIHSFLHQHSHSSASAAAIFCIARRLSRNRNTIVFDRHRHLANYLYSRIHRSSHFLSSVSTFLLMRMAYARDHSTFQKAAARIFRIRYGKSPCCCFVSVCAIVW